MAVDEILKLDKNEQVIQRIRRHPIGLYGIYTAGLLGSVTVLYLLFIALSSNSSIIGDISTSMAGVTAGVIVLFIMLFTYIGAFVYRSNELVVTNENIIQVLQFSVLSRQVSQLNLAKIQDVSVDQNGLLANLFGYGTIEIETAGEASNFKFVFTSDPNKVAKIVIEAHEDYIRNHPAGHNTYRI